MIVYATHSGGRYLPIKDSLREQPEGKRGVYVNLTNQCNCACTFCLRHMKEMAEESSLWLKTEPAVEQVKAELDNLPWEYVSEVVFCGFGEPTMRLDAVVELLKYIKAVHPEVKTRLNTNGLSDLAHGRSTAGDFAGGLLDALVEADVVDSLERVGFVEFDVEVDFPCAGVVCTCSAEALRD